MLSNDGCVKGFLPSLAPSQLSIRTTAGTVARLSPGNPDASAAPARPMDRAAVDAWVLTTLPRAIAFAAGLLRHDRDLAEDVVHDCYCRLLAKADQYDLPGEGVRLLFRSITNACIDRARRKKAISLSLATDDDDQPIDPADNRTAEPWQVADHDELRRSVAAGLDKLPPTQRAALELKSMGQSLEEIGEALGITANNAGVLVYRARQALAKHIGVDSGE